LVSNSARFTVELLKQIVACIINLLINPFWAQKIKRRRYLVTGKKKLR
jgi:hypothetical protein